MTYSAKELSTHDGNPAEIYEFQRGTIFYRYSTTTAPYTYNLQTYEPERIARTKIEQGAEINKSPVKITVPWNNAVAALYLVQPPGIVVTVVIRRFHRDDNNMAVIFRGRIMSCNQRGSVAEITCESIYSSMKRSGLRRNYQTLCPHVLYGPACGVQPEPYKTIGVASAINGTVITVPEADALPDNYFRGGFLQHNAVVLEYDARIILDHTGSAITIASPILGMPVNASVWLLPGCNHTIGQCESRFANSENHGGFPFRPDKNPFNTVIF